jgi:alpha-mannosidase
VRILDASVARRIDVDLDVRLILDADSRVLRVHVHGVNRRRDHRLRLAIHTDVDAQRDSTVWADAAFGPVHRRRIAVQPSDAAAELPPPTAPLHRYASRFDDSRGVTVFSDGLAECEARDDGSLAVTLVRAVGELSRNDLPERPGHAGWPSPTPGAQCLGPFAAELGVLLHGSREPATVHAIEQAADDFLLPLVGTTLRSALSLPDPVVGFELVGEGLACSAIKESEAGGAIVLRCVNLLDQPVRGAWRLPFEPTKVALARIDETPMRDLECRGREAPFEAAPRGIVTLLVR